jgi:hypothetical protein
MIDDDRDEELREAEWMTGDEIQAIINKGIPGELARVPPGRRPVDTERVSLSPLDPEQALKALLATPPRKKG